MGKAAHTHVFDLDIEQIVHELLPSSAVSPADALGAPRSPGVYAWWSKEAVLGGVPGTPHSDAFLYYVGKAKKSLRSRLRRHISGTTRTSTLRTTFAALWQPQYEWEAARARTNPRETESPARFRTVLASTQHEAELSELITKSLIVSWVEHPDPALVERVAIERLRPPLNLQQSRRHPSYGQVDAMRRTFNASATLAPPRTGPPGPETAGDLAGLTRALRGFASAREWEQFHTPKNLAMALAGEVGELLAEIQWLTEEQIALQMTQDPLRGRVADEIADVLMYLVRFADVCGIDPMSAAWEKIERNEVRYPVDKARGNARKYTDLADEDQA